MVVYSLIKLIFYLLIILLCNLVMNHQSYVQQKLYQYANLNPDEYIHADKTASLVNIAQHICEQLDQFKPFALTVEDETGAISLEWSKYGVFLTIEPENVLSLQIHKDNNSKEPKIFKYPINIFKLKDHLSSVLPKEAFSNDDHKLKKSSSEKSLLDFKNNFSSSESSQELNNKEKGKEKVKSKNKRNNKEKGKEKENSNKLSKKEIINHIFRSVSTVLVIILMIGIWMNLFDQNFESRVFGMVLMIYGTKSLIIISGIEAIYYMNYVLFSR